MGDSQLRSSAESVRISTISVNSGDVSSLQRVPVRGGGGREDQGYMWGKHTKKKPCIDQ